MKFLGRSGLFFIIALLGFWLTVLAVFDVIYDKGWMVYILVFYVLLIVFTFYLVFFVKKKGAGIPSVEEFERELSGELYHFKCPTCAGIFAVKKSAGAVSKYVKMTCPDCGAIGVMPPNPEIVEEEVPEKKSLNAIFKCSTCGQGLTVWAEGADLCENMQVYTCPFCGEAGTMKKN